MSNILRQLDAALSAAKLSQTKLAVKANLSRMTVQKALADSGDPRLSTLEAMARELGLELLLVPSHLRLALEDFIRSGGRFLGQPTGAEAPPSIVEQLQGTLPSAKGGK
ncbi:MAG: helix-turn-helix domain-containing protein [Proteobacteria bacterium]|nr:helix-turn-helix domain-containing protein [Pseudomonadota bacterium]